MEGILIYKRKTRSLNKEIVYRQTRHEVNSQHTVMMRDLGEERSKYKRAFCMYNRARYYAI